MSVSTDFSGVSLSSLEEDEAVFDEVLEKRMDCVITHLTSAIDLALRNETKSDDQDVASSPSTVVLLKVDYYLTRLCKYANKMFAKVDAKNHSDASGIKVLIYAFVLLDRQASALKNGNNESAFNVSAYGDLVSILERFAAAFTVAMKLTIDCEVEFTYLAKITGLRETTLRKLEAQLLMDVRFDVLMDAKQFEQVSRMLV